MTGAPKLDLPAPALVGVASRPEALTRFADTDAATRTLDVVEARIDLYTPQTVAACAAACARLEATGTPVIVTIRLAAERGGWSRPDSERIPLYREAIAVASLIDIEAASPIARDVTALAREAGRTSVVSHHDFSGTPSLEDLERIVAACFAAGGDIAKVATLVNTDADRTALFALLRHHGERVCVIGMSATSPGLRVQLAALGSRLAYGYLDVATAPGQISAASMNTLLAAASPTYAARRAARLTAGRVF